MWERNPFTLLKAAAPQVQPSAFEKLYLASWLIDGGKQLVLVGNSETSQVQRIVAEPNQNNLRLAKIRLNLDPRLVEAVISDGSEVGTVKFRYNVQFASGAVSPSPPGDGNGPAQNPFLAGYQAPSGQSQSSSLQQTMPVDQAYRIYGSSAKRRSAKSAGGTVTRQGGLFRFGEIACAAPSDPQGARGKNEA